MIMIKIATVPFLATVFECADISRVILWRKKATNYDNDSTISYKPATRELSNSHHMNEILKPINMTKHFTGKRYLLNSI